MGRGGRDERRWPGLAAAFLAAALGGPAPRPCPAADDVVGAGDRPRVEPPQPADASVDEGAFVVALGNGDRLTGSIVGLDATAMRFRPDAIGEATIDLPLARIEAVERREAAEPFEPRGDRLLPTGGGVIHGTLEDIDARSIGIDAHLIGPVRLPLDAVAAFVREGVAEPQRTAAARFHEVHDSSGSRLVGHLDVAPAGLAVTTDGLTATLAVRQVAAILFPTDRGGQPEAEAAAAGPASCTVEMTNGSEVVGSVARLDQGRLVVDLGPGNAVRLPLEHVARLSFGSAAGPVGGRRRVVFWTTFADAEEEAAHMAEALREGLPRDWTVDAEGAFTSVEDLGEALRTAGVLVVPEMENYDSDEAPDAADVGRLIRDFLGRGGTLVVAGLDDSTAGYWKATGLFSVTSSDREDDGSFELVRGHPLARDVGEDFEGVNGTNAYETDDEDLEPVARRRDGAAAVLCKRAGPGSIVVLGMDYFERSDAIDRLLVNAATRSRRP